jgi:hypothetical protein
MFLLAPATYPCDGWMFSRGGGLYASKNSRPGSVEAITILRWQDEVNQRESIHDGRYDPMQSITMEGRTGGKRDCIELNSTTSMKGPKFG